MYAIICNARCGESMGIEKLALVDRNKSKKYWWTSDNANIILNYIKKSAAEWACKRLKKNNAMVVDYKTACKIIKDQANGIKEYDTERMINQANADNEMGWDGHKNSC
jgi:hypothetical protein